ncbi:MAG: EVE domain-containing protein [Alphaproteobacteria bacterium]|nr:EVE domain-containing protein [Alphaproteobacteria bacterium]
MHESGAGPARDWIAVACAEHVARGVAGGFMQVCHGKAAPLRRLRPGDRVAYYSPTRDMGEGPRLQSFTAIGVVLDDVITQIDMGGGFRPFRRAVRFAREARPAAIAALQAAPGFALAGPGWGARLRYGLLAIDAASMDLVAAAMGLADSVRDRR